MTATATLQAALEKHDNEDRELTLLFESYQLVPKVCLEAMEQHRNDTLEHLLGWIATELPLTSLAYIKLRAKIIALKTPAKVAGE